MIKRITLFLVFYAFSSIASAQDVPEISLGDDYFTTGNDASHPCITEQEYALIEKRCADNVKLLGLEKTQRSMMTTSLSWPLRPSANEHDCSYYHIAAYVDQDTLTGTYHDYNCGTNTYDGHRGTDIADWPFNFYKMDSDLVEVVAAAPGIIIDKHDGEFDRNCSSNTLTANYVIIQHADGSYALYWHMKKNSITTIAIGQPVATGAHLGVVGASGSASGPHLHFEVWAGSTSATRKDPYAGTCNTLNASSWWAAQKPYKETCVMRASAHTTDIIFPPCPTTETLNEGSTFQIPFQGAGLSPGYAKFYIFLRDEVSGLTANVSILNPNSSTYLSWTYTSTANNKVNVWGWSKLLPTVTGTYTFQAIYNGITCSSTFNILNPAGIDEIHNGSFSISPNPSHNSFAISFGEESDIRNRSLEIYDVTGREVFLTTLNSRQQTLNPNLSGGIYLVRVEAVEDSPGRGEKVWQQKLVIE
jgi:hypothetical protein